MLVPVDPVLVDRGVAEQDFVGKVIEARGVGPPRVGEVEQANKPGPRLMSAENWSLVSAGGGVNAENSGGIASVGAEGTGTSGSAGQPQAPRRPPRLRGSQHVPIGAAQRCHNLRQHRSAVGPQRPGMLHHRC